MHKSHFVGDTISNMDWSPEGDRLAVAFGERHADAGDVALYSTSCQPVVSVRLIGNISLGSTKKPVQALSFHPCLFRRGSLLAIMSSRRDISILPLLYTHEWIDHNFASYRLIKHCWLTLLGQLLIIAFNRKANFDHSSSRELMTQIDFWHFDGGRYCIKGNIEIQMWDQVFQTRMPIAPWKYKYWMPLRCIAHTKSGLFLIYIASRLDNFWKEKYTPCGWHQMQSLCQQRHAMAPPSFCPKTLWLSTEILDPSNLWWVPLREQQKRQLHSSQETLLDRGEVAFLRAFLKVSKIFLCGR